MNLAIDTIAVLAAIGAHGVIVVGSIARVYINIERRLTRLETKAENWE